MISVQASTRGVRLANKGIREGKGEEGAKTVNSDWNCSVLDQLGIKKSQRNFKNIYKNHF